MFQWSGEVAYQRSNVTLDATRTQTNDQDGYNETTQTSAIMQSSRNGSAHENQQTDHVHTTEQHNGFVFSEILIGDNSTRNRSNCAVSTSAQRQ